MPKRWAIENRSQNVSKSHGPSDLLLPGSVIPIGPLEEMVAEVQNDKALFIGPGTVFAASVAQPLRHGLQHYGNHGKSAVEATTSDRRLTAVSMEGAWLYTRSSE